MFKENKNKDVYLSETDDETAAMEEFALPAIDANAFSITPERARWLLTLNTENRKVRYLREQKLEETMLDGRYLCNGETIIIADRGAKAGNNKDRYVLLNGQHTCGAVIKSNKTIKKCISVVKYDERLFETIDTHGIRTAGDALYVSGYKNYSGVIAAVTNLLHHYRIDNYNPNQRPSNAQVTELAREFPAIIDAAVKAMTTFNEAKLFMPPAVLGLTYWLQTLVDEKSADVFFGRLASGENLKKGQPEFHLRKALLNDKASRRGSGNRVWILALTLKALSAYNTNKKLEGLKQGRNEAIPRLLDRRGNQVNP